MAAVAEVDPSGGRPTDEQIDSGYTGLDREIAEQFISASMEPGLMQQRNTELQETSDSLQTPVCRISICCCCCRPRS